VVLSSNPELDLFASLTPEQKLLVRKVGSYEQAMDLVSEHEQVEEVFVIGGSGLIGQALGPFVEHTKLVFRTRINRVYESDVAIPPTAEAFASLFVSKTER